MFSCAPLLLVMARQRSGGLGSPRFGWGICPSVAPSMAAALLVRATPVRASGVIAVAMQFTQTLRGIEIDSPRPTLLVWIAAGLGLALWGAWLATAHVTLYATAISARLEAASVARQIAVPAAGLVVAMPVHLGDTVKAGDVLVALDATAETLAIAAQKTQMLALTDRQMRLDSEISAREAARTDASAAAEAEAAVAQTHTDEALAALGFARGRLERLQGLARKGGTAAADVLKAEAEVETLAAQQQGAVSDVLRIGLRARADDRRAAAEIEALRADLSALAAQIADAKSTLSVLETARDRRTLRAPIDGVVGSLMPVQTGGYVATGAPILTLVPAGDLTVAAVLDADAALGRVTVGEAARVHREGGGEHGSFAATVSAVAADPVDGQVRVELTPEAGAMAQLDLRHGQTVAVDIATREVTPLAFVLGALGWSQP